jgi:hypothetical protein
MQNNWAEQPSAILRWFAAMVMHMEAVHVERYLMHILAPLYRITDDDTIRDSGIGKSCCVSAPSVACAQTP